MPRARSAGRPVRSSATRTRGRTRRRRAGQGTLVDDGLPKPPDIGASTHGQRTRAARPRGGRRISLAVNLRAGRNASRRRPFSGSPATAPTVFVLRELPRSSSTAETPSRPMPRSVGTKPGSPSRGPPRFGAHDEAKQAPQTEAGDAGGLPLLRRRGRGRRGPGRRILANVHRGLRRLLQTPSRPREPGDEPGEPRAARAS